MMRICKIMEFELVYYLAELAKGELTILTEMRSMVCAHTVRKRIMKLLKPKRTK